jgi:hypothetical protein
MSNIRVAQAVGFKLHVRKFPFALSTIALALLSAGAAQAGPNANPNANPNAFTTTGAQAGPNANANPNATSNGAVRGVTRMENANYHATKNCGGVYVMTPQPGTDLMPVDAATVPPGVEAFYARAARQRVKWVDTIECAPKNVNFAPSLAPGMVSSETWSGW